MDWLENKLIDLYDKCVDFIYEIIRIRPRYPEIRIYDDQIDEENHDNEQIL